MDGIVGHLLDQIFKGPLIDRTLFDSSGPSRDTILGFGASTTRESSSSSSSGYTVDWCLEPVFQIGAKLIDTADISGLSNATGYKCGFFSDNKLQLCSNITRSFKNLITLDISYNHLTKLEPLLELSLLRKLNASHNQITQLPIKLSAWKLMACLDLGHNRLKSVAELADLKLLSYLVLTNNEITELPIVFAELPLRVRNNPNFGNSNLNSKKKNSLPCDCKC